MNLCHQIKKYRTERNLSQKDLAEKIYVSTQTISNWENERSYPDIQNLLLMSVLFDVTLDDLVKGDVEEMKECIERKEMKRWAWVMAVFLILFAVSIGVVSILPDKFVWWGILVSFTLGVLGFYASLKIEKIKKKENISTYREITAYFDNGDIEELQNLRDKKKDNRYKALMGVIFAVIGMLIAFLSSFIANFFL